MTREIKLNCGNQLTAFLLQWVEKLRNDEKKAERTTMYIKNRRNSNKIKGFDSYQSLYLNESLVLQNRLLFYILND